MNLEKELRSQLLEGKKITVEWDCGGDEALIYPSVNSQRLPYDNEMAQELESLLIHTLDLPSVGEYFVKGGGEIFLKEGQIIIKHQSEANGPEYDHETWEVTGFIEEQIEGEQVLFG